VGQGGGGWGGGEDRAWRMVKAEVRHWQGVHQAKQALLSRAVQSQMGARRCCWQCVLQLTSLSALMNSCSSFDSAPACGGADGPVTVAASPSVGSPAACAACRSRDSVLVLVSLLT
jgi:hypothetical protein